MTYTHTHTDDIQQRTLPETISVADGPTDGADFHCQYGELVNIRHRVEIRLLSNPLGQPSTSPAEGVDTPSHLTVFPLFSQPLKILADKGVKSVRGCFLLFILPSPLMAALTFNLKGQRSSQRC